MYLINTVPIVSRNSLFSLYAAGATTAFTTAPSLQRCQPRNFHLSSTSRASARRAGAVGAEAIPYHRRRSCDYFSGRGGSTAAFNMLSDDISSAKDVTISPTKLAATARLCGLGSGGDGGPDAGRSRSSSGNLGGLYSDGGSSGPPRSGGLGRWVRSIFESRTKQNRTEHNTAVFVDTCDLSFFSVVYTS